MEDSEKEMPVLDKINDFPSFRKKWEDFSKLWDNIKDVVDISIDNILHFSSLKSFHLSRSKGKEDIPWLEGSQSVTSLVMD